MDILYKNVVQGALLHDIGKLVRRARQDWTNHSKAGYNYLSEKDLHIDSSVKDCLRYHHGAKIPKDLDKEHIAWLVYVADNIAAGADRRESDETADKKWDESISLANVFNVFKDNLLGDTTSFPLNTIKDDFSFIDSIKNCNAKNQQPNYDHLFHEFDATLSRMNFSSDSIDSLLQLLEVTMAFIPSSTSAKEIADISLYNHSRITAAVAGCIYYYFAEKDIKDYKKYCLDKDYLYQNDVFMLVSGDLSGIQDFIYTVSSKGALKMLRGRSFYLEMVCEHIIDEILSSCDLCRANVIYSGGGHFYLLLPNTEKCKTILQNAMRKINDDLYKQTNSLLAVSISEIAATGDKILNGREKKDGENIYEKNILGELFQQATADNSRKKLSRYDKEQLENIMLPKENEDENVRECQACSCSGNLTVQKTEDDEIAICDTCAACLTLGGSIPKLGAGHLLAVTRHREETSLPVPSVSDACYYITVMAEEKTKEMLGKGRIHRVYSVNSAKAGEKFAQNLWIGNYAKPGLKESNITFEELADQAQGIKRLGVLRADIDDLGTAFSKGFESKNKEQPYRYVSLSRSSMLSYLLSVFFKKDINQICAKEKFSAFSLRPDKQVETGRTVSIVYSGGDDMFVVGAWDQVLELAVDISHHFKTFTNGKLTLSAGFGIFPEKFPIAQMAQITGELEDAAKRHDGKNAIALFGKETIKTSNGTFDGVFKNIYNWQEFEENVCKEKLHYLFSTFAYEDNADEKLTIGNSMIYKLLGLLREMQECGGINLARLAYTLARLEPDGKDEQKNLLFHEFKTKFFNWTNDQKHRQQLITALYLYVYLNRESGDK